MTNNHTFTEIIDSKAAIEATELARINLVAAKANLKAARKERDAAEWLKTAGREISASALLEARANVEIAESAFAVAERNFKAAERRIPKEIVPAKRVAEALMATGLPVEHGHRLTGEPAALPALSVIPEKDGTYDRKTGTYGLSAGKLSNLAKVRIQFHGNQFSVAPDKELIEKVLRAAPGFAALIIHENGVGKGSWTVDVAAYDEIPAIDMNASANVTILKDQAEKLIGVRHDEATMTISKVAHVGIRFNDQQESTVKGVTTRTVEATFNVTAGHINDVQYLTNVLSELKDRLIPGFGVLNSVEYLHSDFTKGSIESRMINTAWGTHIIPAKDVVTQHFTFRMEAVCKLIEPAPAVADSLFGDDDDWNNED